MNEIANNVKKLGLLYFTKGRLKAAEILTVFMSSAALALVLIPFGLLCLIFVSISFGRLLTSFFEPYIAYLFVASFYILIIVFIVVFRRWLIVDPIARFMSRLLLEEPVDVNNAGHDEADRPDEAQPEQLDGEPQNDSMENTES